MEKKNLSKCWLISECIWAILLALALMLTSEVPGWSAERQYPIKPIKMVLPFGLGGSTDISSRIMADAMSEFLGQPLVTTAKPGATGTIAARFVAAAKPDGYTILGGQVLELFMFYPRIIETANYSKDDFVHLFGYATTCLGIFIRGDSPWQSLNELISDAKGRPFELKYASFGTVAIPNLIWSLIESRSGIQTTYVPFDSSGKALAALLGNHVDMVFIAPGSGLDGLLKAGRVRGLAVSSSKQTKIFPGIPTLNELGIPIKVEYQYAMAAPKGTPEDIANKLTDAARKAFQKYSEQLDKRFFDVNMETSWFDRDGIMMQLKETEKMYNELIRELKIQTFR